MIPLVFMTGLASASVPLYRMFCQATGLNGTTQRANAAPGAVDHTIRIDFDTNVAPHMGWKFVPESPSDTVDVGARDMAFFTATNTTDHTITGSATFNVTPYQVGKYFTKIQCFCFTQQTLKPGETARMPVIFFVDPKILADPDANDVQTITLSYTFYPVDSTKTKG
ncbi:cytochrome c oxidase assembly protein [Sphingomonas populi]|uniref:Cytochrome c oxidase assembly protein CtaG n=2 Tax=Sphingomonas populi TaxID=2484750 RepID=A0A4Q6XYH0_9SPHN|nr:cytochrome c oxidase assembly protein [Sphingomonas populi]RZF65702.1 cytochrome c oxidase assembly protein [Sphingomonas populi]